MQKGFDGIQYLFPVKNNFWLKKKQKMISLIWDRVFIKT